ncbi:MAG: metallophosphoesterase [Deltaproteobacteria bacterium GWA2_38_16]|nr:MAG: metallophosphoesterase [Deltaproteobacteria bacterium GWA2_38_16]OGQ02320.1 MAG: metallophosphoesterase [Deltaproteobacteria bacterium RIFCSPHIGHO2_02_FULL_38_15]OGQ30435.1 MAG: metallophosphoesterase [Deltaproteobacteria bacterium RIFCSPLOWO2_01_FULL_38_9]OGQ61999.1 MAG: metallophosphoesterase [Deltaproteobacteria bacterium RIFCSPLOWO2_12_FULL_38_8]HBQ22088.1 TIGR00282 family metallophosphoesterase [Deltaproteobacteria bacterium]
MVRILFIGDIVGEPGRQAIATLVPRLREREKIDFVIANSENAAGGVGVTPPIIKSLLESKVDVLTSGNHAWDKKEGILIYDQEPRLIRPANYPKTVYYPVPGKGSLVLETKSGVKVGVINLMGRVFLDQLDCPFQVGDEEWKKISSQTKVIIIDIHAETTSEKKALAFFFEGRVSAVLGTHTHVQTADEQILRVGGTAFISDAGMTGPHDSVIGVDKEKVLRKFLTRMPAKYDVAKNDVRLQGVIIDIEERTGKATAIRRVNESL